MLAEAQAALHSLMTGSRIAEITNPNGGKVSFAAADADKLRAYITQLQQASTTPRRSIFVEYGR